MLLVSKSAFFRKFIELNRAKPPIYIAETKTNAVFFGLLGIKIMQFPADRLLVAYWQVANQLLLVRSFRTVRLQHWLFQDNLVVTSCVMDTYINKLTEAI